jgi:hypothetical protein
VAAAHLVENELLLSGDELRLQVLLVHGVLVPGICTCVFMHMRMQRHLGTWRACWYPGPNVAGRESWAAPRREALHGCTALPTRL